MPRHLFISAIAAIAVIGCASPAVAMEFQLGATLAQLSKSDEHDDASTVMPTLALGFNLSENALLFIEGGVLNYTVDKSGDRSSKATSQGTIDVQGTSYAAILARRTSFADFRLGYGIIQYKYDNKLSSGLKQELQSLGITNVKEDLDPTSATQWIAGIDFDFTSWLKAGIEYRSVTVKTKVKGGGSISGTPFTFSDDADLSHSWLAYRIALAF